MAVTKACIFLVLAVSIWVIDGAHHSGHTAPAPAVDCTSVVMNMADCLTYVQNGSTLSKPEQGCCSGLKTVLKTDAECLCEAFKNSASFGIVLDLKKAMNLPAACKISTPAPSCGMSVTAGAPGLPPTAIAGAPTTSITGASETAPAPAPGSSAASILGVSLGSVVIGVVAASLSSF